jgi:hypothetical protein
MEKDTQTNEDSLIVERAFGRVLASVASGVSISDAFRFECSSRGALHPSLARFARAFRLHDHVHRPLPLPKLSKVPLFDLACVVGASHEDLVMAIKQHTTEALNLPPKVLFRFPNNAPLPAENFAQFCLPTQATIETLDEHDGLFPPESPESRLFGHRRSLHRGLSSHAFILAGSDTDSSCELKSLASGQQSTEVAAALGLQVEGRVRYCVCISLLEPYLPLIHCDSNGKVDVGIFHEDSSSSSTSSSSHPFVVERVFCIVSRYPLFNLLFKIARSFAANWRLSAYTSIDLAVKNIRDKAAAEKMITSIKSESQEKEVIVSPLPSSPPLPPSSAPAPAMRSLFGWTKTESPKIAVSVDAQTSSVSSMPSSSPAVDNKKVKKTYISRVVGSYWKRKRSSENSISETASSASSQLPLPLTPEIEAEAIRTLEESMSMNCSSSIPLLTTLYTGRVPTEGSPLIVPIEINQQLGNAKSQYIRTKAPTLPEVVSLVDSNNLTLIPSDLVRPGEFPHLPFTLSQPLVDALDNTRIMKTNAVESCDIGAPLESDEARLGISQWTASIFFSLLPLDSILLLVGAALTERKIIFVAQKLPLECVSACALCMSSLIRPLNWVGPLLPTLPDALIELLMSPVPLITGVTYLPEGFELDESSIVVDLDDASIKFPESGDDDSYLGIRLPLYNDLYYKLLPLTSTVHVVDGNSAPKVVFIPTEDQLKTCLSLIDSINIYCRNIIHYTVSHGVSSASPLRQRFLPSLSSIKTQVLRNCRPSELLFWRRFLSSQLFSHFLEASSRRLLAREPLMLQTSTEDPANEVEIEADQKSLRLWTDSQDRKDFVRRFDLEELAGGGLKRTIHARKLGDTVVSPSFAKKREDNHLINQDDNTVNDDDDGSDNESEVNSDTDILSGNDIHVPEKDISILSKSYSEPFQLIAIIKKMKLKRRERKGI